MKKLMIYLKDYRKESVLAPLFKLLEALFDLLVPIVVARIPRGCGTCLQHHRAVFCRQGIGGLRDQDPAGAV